MQVDNPLHQRSLFSPPPFNDYSNDISDFFHTELFTNPTNSPSSTTSRASSPSALLTPPQSVPLHSFSDPTSNPSFNFLDDDPHASSKPLLDPMSAAPYDFLASSFAGGSDMMGMGIGIDLGMGMGMDFGMGMGMMDATGGPMTFPADAMGIDPQLVGTPSTSQEASDFGEDDQDQGEDEEHAADDENNGDADVSASASPSSVSPSSPPVIKSKSRSSKKEKEKEPEREKLTLTIAPVKVGGHGKARKGTIQSGGVVKRSAAAAPSLLSKDKENAGVSVSTMPPPALPLPLPAPSYPTLSSYMPTNMYTQTPNGLMGAGGRPKLGGGEKHTEDDEDELPHDWRPSPEVFSKMTSKEKRQLRNKISARNFRVRRKEYISTLEGDISERDRLLDAIRSELGSTQSENLALRQEIATLKRTLLEGRGIISSTSTEDTPILNLPPPAPLPVQSAAAFLAQQQNATPAPATATLPNLLTPNTQKDVSSISANRFWGGVSGLGGMGMSMGGITPVHRVVLPEVSVMGMGLFGSSSVFNSEEKNGKSGSGVEGEATEKLQENVNPMLNAATGTKNANVNVNEGVSVGKGVGMGGFDGFADVNPFTMKTLDAYRMHLWGKMAAQHHAYQQQNQQHQQQQQQQHQQPQHSPALTGLASSLRPSYFSSPTLSSTSLSALLSGKHSSNSVPPYSYTHSPPPPYSSPPTSPRLGEKEKSGFLEKLDRARERERERETAMYAALASQTLLRRLGSAFWDAFSGGSSSGVSLIGGGERVGGGGGLGRALDEEKVRRVLEGKAVVRVVDVDEPVRAGVSSNEVECKKGERGNNKKMCNVEVVVKDILEESMRSLSLGKKA